MTTSNFATVYGVNFEKCFEGHAMCAAVDAAEDWIKTSPERYVKMHTEVDFENREAFIVVVTL